MFDNSKGVGYGLMRCRHEMEEEETHLDGFRR